MQYRTFGRTLEKVSEVGHGTWTMGSMWGPRDDAEALRSLKKSLELGVNFIDTAFVYGDGHSEQLIAKALKETGKKVFVATKVPPKNFQWPARDHVPIEETFPADHIVQYTEVSLKNLQMECVDLQQLHVWSDNWIKTTDWLNGVEKLKREGKIRYFGISINDHQPNNALKMVETGLIDSVQVIYNLFDQTPGERLLPACQKHRVGVIARVPFDEGSLTGTLTPNTQFAEGDWRKKYFKGDRLKITCERVEKIKSLIKDSGYTLPQIALKFCLSHPAVSTVIPGMRKVGHVEDCSASSDGKALNADLLERLKGEAWPRNFYPSYG